VCEADPVLKTGLTTGLTRITVAAALTLALTACSGDDSSGPAADEGSPEDVVAAAR
jgi:hypothetical protein